MLESCLKILKELIDTIIDYINDEIESKVEVKSRNEQFKKLCIDLLDKDMKTFNIDHIKYIVNYFNNIINNYIKDHSNITDVLNAVVLQAIKDKIGSIIIVIQDYKLLNLRLEMIDLLYQSSISGVIQLNINEIKLFIEECIKYIKDIRDNNNEYNFNINESSIKHYEDLINNYKIKLSI